MLFAPYITWPAFDGSGHVCSFAFQTCALSWKVMRFSWRRRRNLFVPSGVPLNINTALTFLFRAAGYPSASHLLKLDLPSGGLPFVQDSPFIVGLEYLLQ